MTLVFNILRFANISQGDLGLLGAYILLSLLSFNLGVFLSTFFALVITSAIAVLIHFLFYKPLNQRSAVITVFASLGVALMLRSLIQLIWGVSPLSYVKGLSLADSYFGVMLKDREIITFFSVIATTLALSLFLKLSKFGKAMNAYSTNKNLAAICGIKEINVVILTWVLVGALATLSMALLALNSQLTTNIGWSALLPFFAAAILGGVGRVSGAILGGFVIGISEELSVILLPAQYKSALPFVFMMLVLLIRPRGILKGKVL